MDVGHIFPSVAAHGEGEKLNARPLDVCIESFSSHLMSVSRSRGCGPGSVKGLNVTVIWIPKPLEAGEREPSTSTVGTPVACVVKYMLKNMLKIMLKKGNT